MRHLIACAVLAACTSPADMTMTTQPDAMEMVSESCTEATQHSDLAWIQTDVFGKQCSLGGCHAGAASNAGHLNLQTVDSSYAALVGQPAQTASGWTRVVAGDTAHSYLLAAIDDVAGPKPLDGYMPLTAPELCSEKKAAIERWIAAGAPHD
jgi:hypothetical protein|nr:hypothetical protein [Kofleriaceae bacterium]